MALRALQGPTGGGAPVGGTGTTNTIPRWTGASTLGNSGFVDDGSTIAAASRMLAIGTSGTTGARVWIQNNSSGNTLVLVSPSGAGSAFGQLIEAGTNASDYALNIRQRGTANSLVYVRGDGNVGIGTASPAARLHVLGTSPVSTLIVANSTTSSWVEFRGSTSTTVGYVGTGVGLFFGAAAADIAVASVSGKVVFATAATERWNVSATGHLLAGTDNSYDIGASGATRPRTVYAGTGVVGGYLRAGAASAGAASTTTIGNGTSTTATAGAETLPANPLGFIIAHVGTTEVRIPYYAV